MTFPPDELHERHRDIYVSRAELILALQEQTNRITGVIGVNHDATRRELQQLRIDILTADSEPQQTAAGRSLLATANNNRERINAHEDRLDELERWRDGLAGAFRLVNVTMGASLIACIASIIAIWRALT